jgi:hypothetical protein
VSGDGIPVLLTVEEAGELLRIGRTKAYAMAREWRETDGRSGLPVIDLGHVLRVPRQALEELIGAELTTGDSRDRIEETRELVPPAEPPKPQHTESAGEELLRLPTPTGRPRRHQQRIENQLDLFNSKPSSD